MAEGSPSFAAPVSNGLQQVLPKGLILHVKQLLYSLSCSAEKLRKTLLGVLVVLHAVQQLRGFIDAYRYCEVV